MCAGVFSWVWWENQGIWVIVNLVYKIMILVDNQGFCGHFKFNGTIGHFVLNMNLIVKVKLYINSPPLHSNKKTAQKVHSF